MAWGSAYTPDFRVVSTIGASTGTNGANDRRLVEVLNGTPTFVIDSIDTGRYAIRIAPGGVTTNFALSPIAVTPRYLGGLCRLKTPSAFSVAAIICTTQASTAGEQVVIRSSNTGVLQYSFDNGTNWTNSSTTLAVSTIYRLEMFVDFGVSTTHTLKVKLNGVEVINTTGGTAAVTGTNVRFGVGTTTADTYDYADLVTYNDVAQYGILNEWRVIGLEPVSDATHSMTANDFQDQASANLTNATTTSWSKVNDAPAGAPDTVNFVKQVVVRSTSYMEWNLRATPNGYDAPVLVCLAAAMHPVASATANAFAFRLVSGANASAETAIDTSIASNTLEYRKHHYTTEPGGAAWTLAMTQALKARAGFDGTSVVAPPALDAIMAFVVAPLTRPQRPPITPNPVAVQRSYAW